MCMLCVASRKVKYYNLNLLCACIMEKQSFPWIYGTWVNKLSMTRNNTQLSKKTNNAGWNSLFENDDIVHNA